MYTLYIDTHYQDLTLAILKDTNIIAQEVVSNANHSDITISLLEDLLTKNNITIDDLNQIIVINGPGSFTGVRIGIVIAKIIGYTKNIIVKPISYLQALSLNLDKEVYMGLRDKNGVYIGHFNAQHKLIEDYFYLSNKEFQNYNKEVILDNKVDIIKVLKFVSQIEAPNIHNLKPLYIKKIEVLND